MAAAALLALCGSAAAQETIYGPNGLPVITNDPYGSPGYNVYAPDGMTVTESYQAPLPTYQPPPDPYAATQWDQNGYPQPQAPAGPYP